MSQPVSRHPTRASTLIEKSKKDPGIGNYSVPCDGVHFGDDRHGVCIWRDPTTNMLHVTGWRDYVVGMHERKRDTIAIDDFLQRLGLRTSDVAKVLTGMVQADESAADDHSCM